MSDSTNPPARSATLELLLAKAAATPATAAPLDPALASDYRRAAAEGMSKAAQVSSDRAARAMKDMQDQQRAINEAVRAINRHQR